MGGFLCPDTSKSGAVVAFYLFAIECLFADLITLIYDSVYLHVLPSCDFVYFSFLFPCCCNYNTSFKRITQYGIVNKII